MIEKVSINCDGGSRGNPGKAAIGFVMRDGDKIVYEHKERIGIATNNVAEYTALIKALEVAVKDKIKKIEIIMDSELVIKQMRGEYQVKAKGLLQLHSTAKQLEKSFEKIDYRHVSRWNKFQSRADELVNEALNTS